MKNTPAAQPFSSIMLKPGRDKSVRQRHPWIFSGAIEKDTSVFPGSVVAVRDASGKFLAWAWHNAQSQIRGRVISWDERESIDGNFWKKKIASAAAGRARLLQSGVTNSVRLIHGESDGIPGFIVDRFDKTIVFQSLCAGADFHLGYLVDALRELPGIETIWERSDEAVRELEGIPQRAGLVWGKTPGEIVIHEHGVKLVVDPVAGHKTGFYLDQRDSRGIIGDLAREKTLWNCYSYTGGFGLIAAARGAKRVINIDTSAPALEAARRNYEINGLAHAFAAEVADVPQWLRARPREVGPDVLILDPPKFAHNKGQIERACRGYKDINRVGMQLLPTGGVLATFSCSGLITPDLFQKVIFGASIDAPCDMQITGRLRQPEDHPVLLSFPEGEYLKGLLCRKV